MFSLLLTTKWRVLGMQLHTARLEGYPPFPEGRKGKRKQEKERKRGKIAVVMFAISTRMIVMITMLLSMNLKVLLLSLVSFSDSNMRRVIKARRIMTDNNSCRDLYLKSTTDFHPGCNEPKHRHTKANLCTSSAINPGINFALSLDYRQRKNKEKQTTFNVRLIETTATKNKHSQRHSLSKCKP